MIKEQFKKFSKGFVLGAAAMATVMGASCSQPAGSSIDPVPYAQPTPNPNPNTPTNEDKYAEYGGKPYDVTIGNGEYNLHTFMGKDTYFDNQEEADFYISEAATYVKGLKDKIIELAKDRPAAQAYLNDKLNDFQYITHYEGASVDNIANIVSRGTAPIMKDIVKNLNSFEDRQAFEICYRIIANEARKAGAGSKFSGSGCNSMYNSQKTALMTSVGYMNDDGYDYFKNIDYNKEYGVDNFKATASLLNQLLNTAASKMDVTQSDLQRIVNLTLAFTSFEGIHERTENVLKESNCVVDFNAITNAIDPHISSMKQQDNGMELC